jgi:hypothetical protein
MRKIPLLFIAIILFSSRDYSQNMGQEKTSPRYNNVFRIEISRSTYMDEAVVCFFADALFVYDPYDTGKMFSPDANYPQAYLKTSDNVDVAVDGIPLLVSGNECVLPLCFLTQVAGSFTFTATNLASFDSNISVYLEDVESNVLQNLRDDNTYDFTSAAINTTTRFKLHFITPVTPLLNWLGAVSTDWNDASNWAAGAVPGSGSDVYISSVPSKQPHITNDPASPSLCNTLSIYSGASLTIDAGKALQASGTTTNDGTFTIKSDAAGTGSFIDNGVLGSGTYTVEKYLSGTNYYYIGIPVSSANSLVFSASGANRLWYHTEATGLYTEITDDITALNPFQGYVAKLSGTSTINFSGTLNSGDHTFSPTLTGTSAYEGYNLICNPYPSALDIDAAASDATNLETTIWYRSGGQFSTYNWTTHGSTGTPAGQKNIPAMQSFWIKVAAGHSSGTLNIHNSDRLFSTQDFYKPETQSNIFRMNVSNGTISDDIIVGFYLNAGEIFENYDSRKMFSSDINYPQLYSLTSDSVKVVINSYPILGSGEERLVPLGFRTGVGGTFTFNATNLQEFDASIPVYLEDVQQGVMQNFRQDSIYTFTSGVVDDISRFRLHLGNVITGNATVPQNMASVVFSADHTVYVNSPAGGTLEIYSSLGEKIISCPAFAGMNSFPHALAKGIYIVKFHTASEMITRKIVIG